MDNKAMMTRLEVVRKKIDDLNLQKAKLAGELDNLNKQLSDLETQCKDKFDCKIEELPDIIAGLEDQAVKSLTEAETILGLGK